MKAEDVIRTYTDGAADYALARSRSLVERRWMDRWLAAAPRHARRLRVLDLGCGTGRPLAAYAAERGAEVTGVDAVPAMVERFRAALPRARAVEADMRGLDLGERFDAILAWDSFFHLPAADQRAMFATFAAHAAPKAALLFTTGPEAGTAIGDIGGRPLFHESLSPDDYRACLAGAGFRVVDFRAEDPDCDHHTVWLATAA